MTPAYRLYSPLLPSLVALLFLLAACDSGDPIDEPEPADVAGTYRFTELAFQPEAAGVAPANVRDTLDTSATSLQLTPEGDFLLQYQFKGTGPNRGPYFVIGSFGVSDRAVRLEASRESAANLQRLLLSNELSLRRSEEAPGVLFASIERTANLEAYDPAKYAGLRSVPGTLQVRLVR